MEKLTIWYGKATPIVVRGSRQCRLLGFAEKYKGWHTMGKDPSDKRAMFSLASKGYLEINEDQFRFSYPK